MAEKQIIFILGMSRSGSSALARFISLCGASLPERLLGCHDSNPKGHWEPLDALELNELILAEHGTNYFDPTLRLQDEIVLIDEKRERYLEMIRAFLDTCPNRTLSSSRSPKSQG